MGSIANFAAACQTGHLPIRLFDRMSRFGVGHGSRFLREKTGATTRTVNRSGVANVDAL